MPFCRHRCGYCNFSVVAGRDDLIDRFLTAIGRELDAIVAEAQCRPKLNTLFIGGGTPTHLPLDSLERFLSILRDRFQWETDREWTVEANPEDLSDAKLALLSDCGVNRLSLGIQSFNDQKLTTLERCHTGKSAAEVIRKAAEKIDNVSIDLIFAAPGETVAEWERDLRIAASLPVKHVSTYALTFEKGTSFWTRKKRGDLDALGESDELILYDLGREILAAAGMQHYEISNFARPGFRCRHNLAYWQGAGWFAAGPGAAAFVGGRRTVNHRSPTTYLRRIETGQSPVAESESISDEQVARESAAFGVRMIDGIDLNDLSRRTGIAVTALFARELDRLESLDLIQRAGSQLRLTERGIHFADSVASELLG